MSIAPGKRKIIEDISNGEEQIPIPVYNDIDDSFPTPFTYIRTPRLSYTSDISENPEFLEGCDCKDGDCSVNCVCSSLNKQQCAYDFSGLLQSQYKYTINECNVNCKCNSRRCLNRVVQKGITLPLEVFRTSKCGFGLRCRKPIAAGQFICTYVGEITKESETEARGNMIGDEYLMNMDTWCITEDVNDDDRDMFALDAKWFGNIGRFINHSCDPNIYTVPVFIEYQDKRLPHSCFFALRDIPAYEELCYDYKYVQLKNKHKICCCGSKNCKKYLY